MPRAALLIYRYASAYSDSYCVISHLQKKKSHMSVLRPLSYPVSPMSETGLTAVPDHDPTSWTGTIYDCGTQSSRFCARIRLSDSNPASRSSFSESEALPFVSRQDTGPNGRGCALNRTRNLRGVLRVAYVSQKARKPVSAAGTQLTIRCSTSRDVRWLLNIGEVTARWNGRNDPPLVLWKREVFSA